MAMANITCTCAKCGEQFLHRKECRNLEDVKQYTEWATEHITVCPTCYSKQISAKKEETADEFVKKYNLPEINAVSEKQLAYATSLRSRFIAENAERFAQMLDNFASLPEEKKEQLSKKTGLPVETLILNTYKKAHLEKAYYLTIESNASRIIDILKS